MNVLSAFTGIGGIDKGLERAGHRIVAQCEADAFRRRVLARHWPGVPCFHDIREVASGDGPRGSGEVAGNGRGPDAEWARLLGRAGDRIGLVCGGFPCQDLSIAGRRRGLAGDRSGLFFEFARVADAVLGDGGYVLIENVPGLLSSNDGRDFGVVLATLAELGFHDLAWRVLDSRYFGVPQRRRRVFILARRARGRRASEVLLEPESGGGDFEAGRAAGQAVAATASSGSREPGISPPGRRKEDDENLVAGPIGGTTPGGGRRTTDLDGHGAYVTSLTSPRSGSGGSYRLDANEVEGGALQVVSDTLLSPKPGAEAIDGRRQDGSRTDRIPIVSAPVDADGNGAASGLSGSLDGGVGAFNWQEDDHALHDHSPAIGGGKGVGQVAVLGEVDDVAVPIDPKPDGPRYSATGDAVSVPVAYWIGRRLMERA